MIVLIGPAAVEEIERFVISGAGCTHCGEAADGVLVVPWTFHEPGETGTDMLARILAALAKEESDDLDDRPLP